MSWMKWRGLVQGLAVGLLVLVLLIALGGPWLLYGIGLSNIEAMPEPVQGVATAGDMQAIWQTYHGLGEPAVEVLTPYGFIYDMVQDTKPANRPDLYLVYSIVRSYNTNHLRNSRSLWWDLSSASLAIWLTRHWSTEQILAQAVVVSREHHQPQVDTSP